MQINNYYNVLISFLEKNKIKSEIIVTLISVDFIILYNNKISCLTILHIIILI